MEHMMKTLLLLTINARLGISPIKLMLWNMLGLRAILNQEDSYYSH